MAAARSLLLAFLIANVDDNDGGLFVGGGDNAERGVVNHRAATATAVPTLLLRHGILLAADRGRPAGIGMVWCEVDGSNVDL